MHFKTIPIPTGIGNGQDLRVDLAKACSQVQIAGLSAPTETSDALAKALQATLQTCIDFLDAYIIPPPVTP